MSSVIKTDSNQIQDYLTDSSNMSGGRCEGVFIPESSDELQEFLIQKHLQKESITLCGARTGTVGGSIPFGGWLVSLERLNTLSKIQSRHSDDAWVQVGPGVVLKDFQDKVNTAGYYYPPNPTESHSYLGGNIATNASGTRSFKYGSTRKFIQKLKILLVDGSMLDLTRGESLLENEFQLATSKGVIKGTLPKIKISKSLKCAFNYTQGYPLDAVDLFIGSEGTLGIVTEATIQLTKAPQSILGGVFFFKTFDEAYKMVKHFQIMREKGDALLPCSVEYYDVYALKRMRTHFGHIPKSAEAALYIESEVWQEVDSVITKWGTWFDKPSVFQESSIIAMDNAQQRALKEFRHALPEELTAYYTKHGIRKISTDFAIPSQKFRDFQKYYVRLLEEHKVTYVAFGHIGDCNLHINLLPKSGSEHQKYMEIYAQIMEQVIKVGGVIAAEHGIGKIKREWMKLQFTAEQLEQMRELKRAFDPHECLNSGTLLPD
jgi:D-lactate dehydrogenase (cytochrome)